MTAGRDPVDGVEDARTFELNSDEPSPRTFTPNPDPIDYPGHFEIRRVSGHATLRLTSRKVFVSSLLKNHIVGLEQIADRQILRGFNRVVATPHGGVRWSQGSGGARIEPVVRPCVRPVGRRSGGGNIGTGHDPLALELPPDLLHSVDLEVRVPDPPDLRTQFRVALGPGRAP